MVQRGAMNDAAAIRDVLYQAMKECSKSREQIAEEMSYLTGREITVRMLNGYTDIVPKAVLSASGNFQNGIIIPSPTGANFTSSTGSALDIECSGHTYPCGGSPNPLYHVVHGSTAVGDFGWLLNEQTGHQSFYGPGGVFMNYTPPGAASPYGGIAASDGSQSLIFPMGFSLKQIGFLPRSASTNGILRTVIGPTDAYDSSPDQPIGVGPFASYSNHASIASGRLDAGSFVSNARSTFNGLTSAAPAPVPSGGGANGGTAVPGQTSMSVVSSSGNVGQETRLYYLSALTAYGETPVSEVSAVLAYNQADTLSASATNTITCNSYAHADGVIGYRLYVQDHGTLYYVAPCPILGSVVDDGSQRNAPPRSFSSRNISAPVAAAQLQLLGHGIRALNSADDLGSHAGVSFPGGSAVSFDGAAEGDGQGVVAMGTGSTVGGKQICVVGADCSSSSHASSNEAAGGPTVSADAAAGSGASVNLSGSGCGVTFHSTDRSGGLCIVAGSSTGVGSLLTVTFSSQWPGSPNCTFSATGTTVPSPSIVSFTSIATSANNFQLIAGSAVPSGAIYAISYACSY